MTKQASPCSRCGQRPWVVKVKNEVLCVSCYNYYRANQMSDDAARARASGRVIRVEGEDGDNSITTYCTMPNCQEHEVCRRVLSGTESSSTPTAASMEGE